MKTILTDKFLNYLTTIGVWIGLFLLVEFVYRVTGVYDDQSFFWKKVSLLIMLVGSILTIWESSKLKIDPAQKAQVLFLGEQTGIWLEEGLYFLWFYQLGLFSLEFAQSHRKNDSYVEAFEALDKNRKPTLAHIDADWHIVDSEVYKLLRPEDMKRNLETSLRKQATTLIGGKVFATQLLGFNHGDDMNTPEFKTKMKERFGIEFTHIDCIVNAQNITQEGLNSYAEELTKTYEASYGAGYPFTHKEHEEIANRVQTQIGLAKKFILKGRGSAVGRYDM